MDFVIDKEMTQDIDKSSNLEWLETNGIGGYSSSTVIGMNTRSYHGLLVAAVVPPTDRYVMLSKLDETINIDGLAYPLGTNNYGDVLYPKGYQYLEKFSKGLFSEFFYKVAGIELIKTITMVDGENTTLISYEVKAAPASFVLELLPLIAGRGYHSLNRQNNRINVIAEFKDGVFKFQPYGQLPPIYISAPDGTYANSPDWYYKFNLAEEKERGHDFIEDLFSPGKLLLPLQQGSRVVLVISDRYDKPRDGADLFNKETERKSKLTSKSNNAELDQLLIAADQFLVARDRELKTVIAGYHWFTDWSRDTMISLPGLCLVTGRYDDAKKILSAFSQSVSEGMLPNRFADNGGHPEYNNVDGTLWFFIAVYKYYQTADDNSFVIKEMLPVLTSIIEWHYKGTRFHIRAGDDGLLYAGEPGVQLTWMDAKVDGYVVTPRTGYAVEINALWYNALSIMAELLEITGEVEQTDLYRKKAKKVKEQFLSTFWFEEGGYLYDVVNGSVNDKSMRPNQLFAISLPFPLLEGEKAELILDIITKELYTPFGLRSLSPNHQDYRGNYSGNNYKRDMAYHQGTVWSWLLGPYADACMKTKRAYGKKRINEIVNNFLPHLKEAGIGTVSEIFDGDWPHKPNGCIAQAWGVAEWLRIYIEYYKGAE